MGEQSSPKKAPATVDEYIAQHPPQQQELLQQVRQTICRAAPNATEKISWGMPTYHQKENLVHFAMHKSHLGFYPSPEAIEAFAKELEPYKKSKGAVQFPLAKPMPYALIAQMTAWRAKQVE